MERVALQPRADARNESQTDPDTSARRFQLCPPSFQLRPYPEFDGMQESRSSRVRKDEQPVVPACRRGPFLFPGLRITEEVNFAHPARERILRCEVRQKLERGTRVVLGVIAGLEKKQAIVVARAV